VYLLAGCRNINLCGDVVRYLILLLLLSGCSPIPACIEGEARNQPQDTRIAIGESIRNRGTLRGVYGCNAGQWPSSASKQAFKTSRTSDLTHGATHFLSKTDLLRPPAWLSEYEMTYKSGDFTFYRRKEGEIVAKQKKGLKMKKIKKGY